jgi:hypothetical protein
VKNWRLVGWLVLAALMFGSMAVFTVFGWVWDAERFFYFSVAFIVIWFIANHLPRKKRSDGQQ